MAFPFGSLIVLVLLLSTSTLAFGRAYVSIAPDDEVTVTQSSLVRRILLQNGTAYLGGPAPSLIAPAPSPSANGTSGNGTVATLVPAASAFVYKQSAVYPYVPALFVFGDSLSDTGNNAILVNSTLFPPPPYGVGPGGRLNLTGRYSNGPVRDDYLAEFLGLPYTTPILQPGGNFFYGANFASGGSGALNMTGTPGLVLTLSNQTQLFTQLVQRSIAYWSNQSNANNVTPLYPRPETYFQALYTFTTGSNDLRGFSGNVSTFNAYAQSILNSVGSSIATTYAYGARNFLITNTPPLGCIPAARNLTENGTCDPTLNQAAQGLSPGFDTLIQGLQRQLPNATFLLFDAYNATSAAIAYPAAFGLTNANQSCCGAGGPANTAIVCSAPGSTVCTNPDQHLFWDLLHPTTAYYQLVARETFGGSTFMRPKNVLDAFVRPRLLGTA